MSETALKQLTNLFHDTHARLSQMAARSINTSLVVRNWLYGWYIVEFEQGAASRQELYGKALIDQLAKSLVTRGIKSILPTNLRKFRQFYLAFPATEAIQQALSVESSKQPCKSLPSFPRAAWEREQRRFWWSWDMSDLRLKNLRDYSGFTTTPIGWTEITIGGICNLGRGRVISQEEINQNPGPYPVYSSQTRNKGQMGSLATFDMSGEYITWTTDGENAGTVFFRTGQFNCTNVCGTLFPKNRDEIDLRFLTYHLGRVAKRYVSYIGNPKLMNGVMSSIGVTLPPIDVQVRISEILSTIDQTIEKTEALIEKYQHIKAGLMHDLFTRGIGADGKLRPPREQAPELYQQTPIGWIPMEWNIKSCTDLCSRICVGIVIQPTQYYVDDGVPAFRSANVRENGIDPTNFVYISPASNNILVKSQVKEGDILSVRTGYPGTSAIVPREFNGANCIDILISTPNEKASSEYLCNWINSSFGKGQVLRQQGGMAQQHFNVGEMRQLLVALPDVQEQELISNRIKTCADKLKVEQDTLVKLQNQKSGLMHDLLTGKVQVNVNEPNTEARA